MYSLSGRARKTPECSAQRVQQAASVASGEEREAPSSASNICFITGEENVNVAYMLQYCVLYDARVSTRTIMFCSKIRSRCSARRLWHV